jgi:hypothetical protein
VSPGPCPHSHARPGPGDQGKPRDTAYFADADVAVTVTTTLVTTNRHQQALTRNLRPVMWSLWRRQASSPEAPASPMRRVQSGPVTTRVRNTLNTTRNEAPRATLPVTHCHRPEMDDSIVRLVDSDERQVSSLTATLLCDRSPPLPRPQPQPQPRPRPRWVKLHHQHDELTTLTMQRSQSQ